MGYYLTQIMSGHGSFTEYTYRIRKTSDERCRMCDTEVDSVEHTVTECPRWGIWREELARSISGVIRSEMDREDVTIRRLVPLMVKEPVVWRAVVTFAVRALTEKEVAEREGIEGGEWMTGATGDAERREGEGSEEEENIEKEMDGLMGNTVGV